MPGRWRTRPRRDPTQEEAGLIRSGASTEPASIPPGGETVRAVPVRRSRRWLSWLGGAIGLALVIALAVRIDWREFVEILRSARLEYVAVTFVAIVLEQLVRAWKWRQILRPVAPVPLLRLFGATMAGWLANLLVPLGLSPFVRSWLVARDRGIAMTSVLATVAIDRLVDGLVFAGIVVFVVVAAGVPDPDGRIGLGLAVSAALSALVVLVVLVLLARHKRQTVAGGGIVLRLARLLPGRFAVRARALAADFAGGIVWPASPWRGAAIVLASVVIKLVAATHLFWAGLAFGVVLPPLAYLGLLAILGFVVTLSYMARIPAGFVVGAVFALGLFGVGEATAFAMVTVVMATNIAAIVLFGAWGLGLYRVGLRDLGRHRIAADAPG